MNNGQCVEKPKYKFPIGGILCIVLGAVSGASVVFGLLNDILSIFLDGGLNYLERLYSFSRLISWINIGLSWIEDTLGLVGALLFIILGIMLVARCHGKLLAVISIIQAAIVGFSIFCFAFNVIISVLSIFMVKYYASAAVIITYTVLPYGFIESLLLLLGWILLTVAVLVNCKKERRAEDSGKLRPLIWIIPGSLAAGYLLSACFSALCAVLSPFASILIRYPEYGVIPNLLLGFGDSLWSVIMAVLCAVTFYFVTDWIVKPYRK